MRLKIIIITILFINYFCGQAQVTPTLFHNNLSNGIQFGNGMDMEIYNNELYMSVTSAGKIVKVSLASPNSTVVDVVTGLTAPAGLKIVGNELYFLQKSNAALEEYTGKLSKINVSLANPPVVDLYSGLMYPYKIDVNGTNVYVAEEYLEGNHGENHMHISMINLSGVPTKTDLYNYFSHVDDFEFKDNFLYIIDRDKTTDKSRILKLDVTNGASNTPFIYYDDVHGDFFNEGVIHNNYLYLNSETNPSVVSRINLNSDTPTTSLAVSGFDFNGNTPSIEGMIADENNNLYFIGKYSNGTTSTFMIYKANVSTLATQDFTKTSKVTLYPNPSADFISFSNLENEEGYQIVSIDGKIVKKGNVGSDEKINVSHFTSGVYTIRVGNKSFKFIKQ